ncbi:unnamed protein product [Arctogadus glacialis]
MTQPRTNGPTSIHTEVTRQQTELEQTADPTHTRDRPQPPANEVYRTPPQQKTTDELRKPTTRNAGLETQEATTHCTRRLRSRGHHAMQEEKSNAKA